MSEQNEKYISRIPGTFGGHRKLKIYGKMDCPSALKWIEKGCYINERVFFADEETAIVAGYRPCSICMTNEYTKWKSKSLNLIKKL
ncbi:MAG: Ada metal-binding domain-containing protein [Tissierellia bacterium]|nr:Ada metal-binding domain-containing protein [Tissierellia bacterium]